jgi:RNA polymerase sigma-70 factor (ECF subfamily)
MKDHDLRALFLRFRDHGDMRALAKVFDDAAPQLMPVAVHLAGRRDDVDDLVQATFLSAIERADSYAVERPLLPWLLGILALHARKLREKQGRVIDAERVRTPAEDDPERLVAAAEVEQAVDAACRELPDAYATIVRRHLIGGLEPIELARELGLSRGAARMRLHRGLKLLRRALPVAFASGAYAATTTSRGIAAIRAVVLERGSLITGSPVPAAGFAPIAIVLAFLVPFVIAVPAWFAWRAQPASEPANTTIAAAPSRTATPVEPTSPVAEFFSSERVTTRGASNSSSSGSSFGALMSNAIVRGRLLLPDGTPAVGASAELQGFEANADRTRAFGLPANWHDPELQHADSDGRFEITLDPPLAFQFTLDVESEQAAKAEWRWDDLVPGSTLDLGDVTLETPARIVARILDAQSHALCTGWTVSVDAPSLTSAQGREPSMYSTECVPGGTEFLIDRVPARRVEVSARTKSGGRVDKVVVDLAPNETKHVDLVYTGPDLTRRITVMMWTEPFPLFQHESLNVAVSRQGMDPRSATYVKHSAFSYVVDDLDPGQYDIAITDPRFVAWTKSGVQPGETVHAALVGSAALRIHLAGADGQQYTGHFDLKAQLSEHHGPGVSTSHDVTLLGADEEPPPNGLFAGLVPGDYALKIDLPDAITQSIHVLALAGGETRDVTCSLAGATTLVGRVLASDGVTPMAGVDVQLTQGSHPGHTHGSNTHMFVAGLNVPAIASRSTTDAQGQFNFVGLAAGQWTVRASWGKYLHVDLTLDLAAQASPIDFVQPPHGSLSGHLLIPDGATIEGTALTLHWSTPDPAGSGLGIEHDASELFEDGSFHFAPLPLGEVSVRLAVGTPWSDSSGSGSNWSGSGDIEAFVIHDGVDTQAELDLRDTYPGRLRAHVTLDGHAASDGFVQCTTEGATAPGGRGQAVGIDGLALIGSIKPGVGRVTFTSQDKTWIWLVPQQITIAPGVNTPLEIALFNTARDLRCVGSANGAPLANVDVEWRTGGGGYQLVAHAKTDAQGLVHLKMPEQNVDVRCVGDTGAFTTIAWSAGSGPLTVALHHAP